MVTDGLGFEEVNQSVTSTAIISGTNVYGATAVTSPTVVATTTLSGLAVDATTVNATTVSGTTVKGNTVNSLEGELQSNITGGSIYGANIQCGSDNVGGGSEIWTIYPNAFTAAPTVIAVGNQITADTTITVGSISVGSFYAVSETASDAYNWIAIGL